VPSSDIRAREFSPQVNRKGLPLMLVHPQFNPVAVSIGSVQIHWYGLTYLVAFGLFLWLASLRVKQPQYAQAGWTRREVEDLLFYGVLGVVVGGRLGYVLFYKLGEYVKHPLEIFEVWKGGMSFHGGLLGVIAALAFFRLQARAPLPADHRPRRALRAHRAGIGAHRQLHQRRALGTRGAGRRCRGRWSFRKADRTSRATLRSCISSRLEGILLFMLLWLYARRRRPLGSVSGPFSSAMACPLHVRILPEPDSFLGLLWFNMSMGHGCACRDAVGVLLWWWSARRATQGA